MTSDQFQTWLELIRPIYPTDADAAHALGRRPQAIVRWKKEGTPDRAVDLACAAILFGLPPYGQGPITGDQPRG